MFLLKPAEFTSQKFMVCSWMVSAARSATDSFSFRKRQSAPFWKEKEHTSIVMVVQVYVGLNYGSVALIRLVILCICCKVYTTQCINYRSKYTVYRRMSLSQKLKSATVLPNCYVIWLRSKVISLALKETMLMYIPAVVFCMQETCLVHHIHTEEHLDNIVLPNTNFR